MSNDAESIINKELFSGELLLWAGMPKQGIVLRGDNVNVILITLAIATTSIALGVDLTGETIYEFNFNVLFILFSMPFIFFGSLFPFFAIKIIKDDSKKRSKTFYGFTNQRVIVITGLFNKTVNSISFQSLSTISFSESFGGYGTVTFFQVGQRIVEQVGQRIIEIDIPLGYGSKTLRFEMIEDVQLVYNQINAQRQAYT
jgi:hypothetical protein